MSIKTITLILSSSVLTAIVTSFFNAIKSEREGYLSNVTSERAKWRETIREIAESLPSGNKHKVEVAIRKLEHRINPYGKYNENDIMADSHIWKIIKDIDAIINPDREGVMQKDASVESSMAMKPSHRKSLLKQKTSILKDHLLLLLKYDWERSKQEVRMNFETKLVIFCGAGIVSVLSVIQVYYFGSIEDNLYTGIVGFWLFPLIIGAVKTVDSSEWKMKVAKILLYISTAICIIAYAVSIFLSDLEKNISFDVFLFLLMTLALLTMVLVERIIKNNIQIKYREEVTKIRNMDEKMQ